MYVPFSPPGSRAQKKELFEKDQSTLAEVTFRLQQRSAIEIRRRVYIKKKETEKEGVVEEGMLTLQLQYIHTEVRVCGLGQMFALARTYRQKGCDYKL